MPDIREPSPVKPIWPSRPGRAVGEKQAPKAEREQEEEEEKKKRKQPPDNDRPHIDDYA